MSSRETDQRVRAERRRLTDAALRADREGRDRAADLADQQPADDDKLNRTPNTGRPL